MIKAINQLPGSKTMTEKILQAKKWFKLWKRTLVIVVNIPTVEYKLNSLTLTSLNNFRVLFKNDMYTPLVWRHS